MATIVRANDLLPAEAVIAFATDQNDLEKQQAFIVFEMDDRPDPERGIYGAVRIRHYPSGLDGLHTVGALPLTPGVPGITYSVTQGTFQWTNEFRFQPVNGFAEFTGTDRVKLPYPPLKWARLNWDPNELANFTLEKQGTFTNLVGTSLPAGHRIWVDWQTGELRSSVPCHGKVRYYYHADYRVIRYWPSRYFSAGDIVGAYEAENYGKIRAVQVAAGGDVISTSELSVTPVDSPAQTIELYRIEYDVLVNEEGTWEMPVGFPSSVAYPGTDPAEEFDVNAPYMKVTRLVEIAYFSLGTVNAPVNANTASSGLVPVPLDFAKAERGRNTDALLHMIGQRILGFTKLAKKNKEYWEDIRRFPKPHMRIDTFRYTPAKPYESGLDDIPYWSQQYFRAGQNLYLEPTKVFRVRLNIKLGKVSTEMAAPTPRDREGNTYDDYMAIAMNHAVYRAWRVIDWQNIWTDIRKRYPRSLYSYNSSEIEQAISRQTA